MEKYLFYRGRKITLLLLLSTVASFFIRIVDCFFNPSYSPSIFLLSVLMVSGLIIVYSSVYRIEVNNEGIVSGILFRRKAQWDEVVQICMEGNKFVLYYVIGSTKRKIKINKYILMPNRDKYLELFETISKKAAEYNITLDKQSYEHIVRKKPIAIDDLFSLPISINGALVYYSVGIFGIGFFISPVTAITTALAINIYENSYLATALSILIVVASAVLSFAAIKTFINFMKKRSQSKELAIICYIGITIVNILTLISNVAELNVVEPYIMLEKALSAISLIFTMLVAITYFKTSVRVMRTFGIMSHDEYMRDYAGVPIPIKKETEPIEEIQPETEEAIQAESPIKAIVSGEFTREDFERLYRHVKEAKNEKAKITFMFYGNVQYHNAKQWYTEIKNKLEDDRISVNKIVASPDKYVKKFGQYKAVDKYEDEYLRSSFTGNSGKEFKMLGFCCTYQVAYDYDSDSFCLGDMSWGSDVYPERLKLSIEIGTAKRLDLFEYIQIYLKYINLKHLHIYEIDYSIGAYTEKVRGGIAETNPGKKLIYDLEM